MEQWHNVIFTWDPSMFNFKVFFNGVVVVNYYADIVSDIFSNNCNVTGVSLRQLEEQQSSKISC